MSNIEWTDATWNPVVGCTPVSPGCLNCYAATMARRLEAMGRPEYAPRVEPAQMGTPYDSCTPERTIRIAEVRGGRAVFTGDVRTVESRLTDPLHWRKPRMVFVNSMSDLFHEAVPFEFIDKVFAVMNATCTQLPLPNDPSRAKTWHTYQILTKRPDRMAEYMESRNPTRWPRIGSHPVFAAGRADGGVLRGLKLSRRMRGEIMNAGAVLQWPLPNVWLGTSVEDQARADERIPHLLKCPAKVRFLSCEPLLGAIDLSAFCGGPYVGLPGDMVHDNYNFGINWIIVGGESGPNARPCDVAWIRSIVEQCRAAGVPCFVKQLGSWVHCRNDKVSDWFDEVGMGLDYVDTSETRMQGDPVRVMLNDRKGGDPAEWPEDLRVREWPLALKRAAGH